MMIPVSSACPVCGDGAAPAGDYFTADADGLGARRDDVAGRLLTVAGLGARIPNPLWRHRAAFAGHVAGYTRTIIRLEARRLRRLGWSWRSVSIDTLVDADGARALFDEITIPKARDRCGTCGSRRWRGAVTDFVPHAVLPPALRRHAPAEPPTWVPLEDEPQASLVSVLWWTHRIGGAGGVRNLQYATNGLLSAAAARDRWDGATDAEIGDALGVPISTASDVVDVPGVLEF